MPALFLLLLCVQSPPAAPAKATDFSGRWTLVSVSPARPGFDAFWLGTEAVVTQTAATLTIRRVAPPPERTAAFQVTGPCKESENVYTTDGVRQVKTSRVTLGTNLLISTETTLPDGKRWLTHINRWSMDPNGDLVVTDTVICGSGECPSIVATVKYKKAGERASRQVSTLAYSPTRLLTGFFRSHTRTCRSG